jgi:hypothetical protein
MADALKVQFDDPQNGGMAMTIRSDETVVTLVMSRVLYNTLDELVDGLRAWAGTPMTGSAGTG